jgi:type II secretory pathway pseudopilin PulG
MTLTIIGVIAALTMPSLYTNIQKDQVGPKLAKAINTLESANGMILHDNQAKSLEAACGNDYGGCLSNYVSGSLESSSNYGLTTQNITTKDGIKYSLSRTTPLGINAQNCLQKYACRFYIITVDINGTNSPNTAGKDQFTFYVDSYGTVIPYGGGQFKEYSGANSVLWETGCKDNSTPTDKATCVGSIVDNGYKVKYNYNW